MKNNEINNLAKINFLQIKKLLNNILKRKNVLKLVVALIILEINCLIILKVFNKKSILNAGLPTKKMTVAPHPFKSYINKPGNLFWNNSEPFISPRTNKKLYYNIINKGTIVNLYGHQVEPQDLNMLEENKSSNHYKILFLGGSTTFLPWPFLVKEALLQQIKNKKISVINAGTGGYTSQENLIDFCIAGLSYNPDLVIAYLPVNDIYWAALYPNFRRDYTHMRIPLKIYDENTAFKKPQKIIKWPFSVQLAQKIYEKIRFYHYFKNSNLSYQTTTQDMPKDLDNVKNQFLKTCEAIQENVENIALICNKKNIRFILLLQKTFVSNNKFCTEMDRYVQDCNRNLRANLKNKNFEIYEMNLIMPDKINEKEKNQILKYFSKNNKINFSEELAYDNMHFSPLGCFLFASYVADLILLNDKKN